MSGWLARFALGLLGTAFGGLLGLVAGREGSGLPGAVIGALLAFGAVLAYDTLRAAALIDWLRGSQGAAAPRDAGRWGEIAYRIERSLRDLERKAEVERSRLKQFVSAMEASPNGVLLLDDDNAIEWCNAVAADHLGLDPLRDRRQKVTNLVRSPIFVGYLQSGAYDEPVVFPASHGAVTLRVTIRRFGADGRKLLLSQDQTERERADAIRRDFVANVSHEIRTPLTVLSGFLETLCSLELKGQERERVLTLMTQQADRMKSLVNDLLALARLEGSPRPPADRWVSVAALLKQAEAAARALSAGRHALSFSGGEPVADAALAGGQDELASAIENLISNAIRYTPEGGAVTVLWKAMENGEGCISVRDTGRGIAREHLPRLTERFYRVDHDRSRETGGTGLGLAIVKHVMQRHGGELDVQSEPEKGSTFRLLFPPARVRLSAQPSSASAAEDAAARADPDHLVTP